MSRIDVVAVLGTGPTATSVAETAAAAGHRVIRNDIASDLRRAGLVVEDGDLDAEARHRLFADLESIVAPDAVLATTASPTAMAAELGHPGRVVGLHVVESSRSGLFAEVVSGPDTDPGAVAAFRRLVESWGSTVVLAADRPGHILDRVTRPFYAEAWRLLEERAAGAEVIDAVLTGAGGFTIGPFASMDAIGHDVCDAVTRTIWAGLDQDPRFAPAAGQRVLIAAGRLGRAGGRGVYDYAGGSPVQVATPAGPGSVPLEVVEHGRSGLHLLLKRSGVAILDGDPDDDVVELSDGAILMRCTGSTAAELAAQTGRPVVVVDRTLDDDTATAVAIASSHTCSVVAVAEATGLLQRAGLDVFVVDDVPGLIVARTVAMLVNFAVDAVQHGVATAADVDIALRVGAGHPIGPLEWGQRWGVRDVLAILDGLRHTEGHARYRASSLLRRWATAGRMPV